MLENEFYLIINDCFVVVVVVVVVLGINEIMIF